MTAQHAFHSPQKTWHRHSHAVIATSKRKLLFAVLYFPTFAAYNLRTLSMKGGWSFIKGWDIKAAIGIAGRLPDNTNSRLKLPWPRVAPATSRWRPPGCQWKFMLLTAWPKTTRSKKYIGMPSLLLTLKGFQKCKGSSGPIPCWTNKDLVLHGRGTGK